MNDPAFWYAKARMELRIARTALRVLEKLEVSGKNRWHPHMDHKGYLAAIESMTIWLCQAVESRAMARSLRRYPR